MPDKWAAMFSAGSKFLSEWMGRVLMSFSYCARYTVRKSPVWAGGIFSPESFVTATKQMTAQVLYIMK